MRKKTTPTYTFEQFTAVRRYGSYAPLSFSPDGLEIAYTVNTSGQFNLWRQSSDGGFPYQLTTYVERTVRTTAWSPDSKWIAYSADQQGDEFYQLFLIPAQGGQPEQLTDLPGVWHELNPQAWSLNGRYLGYNANDRDQTAMDVLVRDMKSGVTKRVLAGNAYYAFANWAPDSTRLLVIEVKTETDMDLYLVDLRDGSSHKLTPHEGDAKFLPGPWAKDGSGFYMLTDLGREFTGLAFFELKTGNWHWVETPKWDVEYVEASQNGRYLAWVVNEDGYSRLYVRNLGTGKLLNLPKLSRGVIFNPTIAPSGNRLAFFLMNPTHCAEVLVLDLRRRTLRQITQSMLGGIDERTLNVPKLVRYPAHDGRKVPAWLHKPRGASAANKMPVILSIHGGPEAQERPLYTYSGMYQYWVSRGIGVFAPNIRGSTGYGKSYQKLIHHDWGGAELKDIEHAAKYLLSLDWVDPKRIAIFGASFGGFAVLSAISQLTDYWAAGVDIVGPSNLVTLIKSGPPHWQRSDRIVIGDPDTEYDYLMSRSPISYVNQIKAPLYIIQGAKDPRVPKNESDQIVERLRARGVQVRYDVFEDEGHGFTKRENELKAWRDTAGFFEKHLL